MLLLTAFFCCLPSLHTGEPAPFAHTDLLRRLTAAPQNWSEWPRQLRVDALWAMVVELLDTEAVAESMAELKRERIELKGTLVARRKVVAKEAVEQVELDTDSSGDETEEQWEERWAALPDAPNPLDRVATGKFFNKMKRVRSAERSQRLKAQRKRRAARRKQSRLVGQHRRDLDWFYVDLADADLQQAPLGYDRYFRLRPPVHAAATDPPPPHG